MPLERTTFCMAFLTLLSPSGLPAQRASEANGRVIYQDANGKRTDLGIGFSPVLSSEGRVAFLRGRVFRYGDDFNCADRRERNWAVVYDPVTKTERILFDGSIAFAGDKWKFCIFEQMQLSHDASVLYLVSPVYTTSGSLAIINLPRMAIKFVPGVDAVYVIETGSHRDELIYVRRVYHKGTDGNEYPAYPIIHANADGLPIREVSS